MTEDEARGLEHAWRYFALHAEQRMTVFNFFVASAGLMLTGLAWTLSEGVKHWPLGAAAGVSAAALSFVFWRLDQRGAQLVKVAEAAMATLENGLPTSAAVTIAERQLHTNGAWMRLSTPWTFGRSFRLLFAVVFLLGIGGAALTTCLGILSGSAKPSSAASDHHAPRAHTGKLTKKPSLKQLPVSHVSSEENHGEIKDSSFNVRSEPPRKSIKIEPRELSSDSKLPSEKGTGKSPGLVCPTGTSERAAS